MENTESGEDRRVGSQNPQETRRGLSRRNFLTKVAPAAVLVTAAVTVPLAGDLIFGKREGNSKLPPTYDDVVDAVNHAYKSTGQEVPEEILKRLPACNEQTTTQDPIKEVLHSCGEVGGGIRDVIENTKDSETRNRLILDLKTVERYTIGKIDEYGRGSKLGKLSDPGHIEGFKDMFKETYFTVRSDKP